MIALPHFDDVTSDWLVELTLEGVPCQFRVWYNDRLEAWMADLYDGDGVAIVRGSLLSPDWLLFARQKSPSAPPGAFGLLRDDDTPDVITRDNLAGSFTLVYFLEAEVDAAKAADSAFDIAVQVVP